MSELRRLANADPAQDFEAAKQKKDIYFIGIGCIGLLIPGVDGTPFYGRASVHHVKGTSDVVTNKDQIPLTLKAIQYADQYNELVIRFLKEQDAREKTKNY